MRSRIDVVETIKHGLFYISGILTASMLLAVLLFALLLLGASYRPAPAQHNHDQHHSSYQNWVNKKGEGCCNNQDCSTLAEQDERTSNGFQEVRVEGEWCPVLPHHYLKKGNAPDWSRNHVCVQKRYNDPETMGQSVSDPCARLLCYQPRPLI